MRTDRSIWLPPSTLPALTSAKIALMSSRAALWAARMHAS